MKDDRIERALRNKLVISDFESFSSELDGIFQSVEGIQGGKNASYIPQLLNMNSDYFGVSVMTVDGQFWSKGDSDIPFTVQSTAKSISYCIVRDLVGPDKIAKHVGKEPAGLPFNAFALDRQSRPCNPMVNLGAIMVCSLFKPLEEQASRFDNIIQIWSDMAASKVGFDNATYLSEFEHADRNYSLAYMAKDAGGFCIFYFLLLNVPNIGFQLLIRM